MHGPWNVAADPPTAVQNVYVPGGTCVLEPLPPAVGCADNANEVAATRQWLSKFLPDFRVVEAAVEHSAEHRQKAACLVCLGEGGSVGACRVVYDAGCEAALTPTIDFTP